MPGRGARRGFLFACGAGKNASLDAEDMAPLRICGCGGVFFPTRGKEPKGDRGQPIRDSTMAAPGPLSAWRVGENLALRKANYFLAGAA